MATANYDYKLPSWYTADYNAKMTAANAARDAWTQTDIPAYAEYGHMVPRAMAHVAAALQGLFEGRAIQPDFGNITDTGYDSWGADGGGFASRRNYQIQEPGYREGYPIPPRDEGVITPGTASNLDRSLSPALYDYFNTDGSVAYLGLPDADSSGNYSSGHAPGQTGEYRYRAGDDGYWWNNVWTEGRDQVRSSLDAAYAEALHDMRINLARKGELGGTSEKFARAQLKKDMGRVNVGKYGDQAVDYFGNLINDDLLAWDSKLASDWERTANGDTPRWYTKTEPDGAGPYVPPGAAVAQYSTSFFDPLITQATGNYDKALTYARGLDPDLASAFAASLARSERGGVSSKTNKGQGQPTAYFGGLGRVGGWDEYMPTQELPNVFPEQQSGGSFSGVRS